MMVRLEYLLPATLIASLLFTYLSNPLAYKLKMVDSPAAFKIHSKAVTRFGGFGIFIAIAIGLLLSSRSYVALLIGALVIWCVGATDDRWTLGSKQKLAGQAAAGLVLFYAISSSDKGPAGTLYGFVAFILVILFSNAINLIDGMNGLAGGNAFLIAVGFALLNVLHREVAIVPLVVAASILGFLPFNFPKARLFMGDSGSLLIGYFLADMLVDLLRLNALLFVCGLIIATLPVFDLTLGILRRALSRQPIFAADRGHFYDRLAAQTNDMRLTVLITYAITAVLAVVACALSFTSVTVSILVGLVIAVGLLTASATLGWLRTADVQGKP